MFKYFSLWSFVVTLLLPTVAGADEKVVDAGKPTPLELFDQRIMPIFKSPQPASCVQCHLAAVDLKDYILPSHEQTFASLRDQGLIDVVSPEKSKILKLIQMGEKDNDKDAVRLHEATRQAEYEAFAAWIGACCADPKLRAMKLESETKPARPVKPDEVIRHARKSRLVDSFVRNVWSQRMRCFPCHTPNEIDAGDAKHPKALQRYEEFVDRFGDRMNLFEESPEATLQAWIERSHNTADDELPLINILDPTKSLIVLKPTAKLPPKADDGGFRDPSSAEPVSHMGGLKMHVHDPSYKAMVAWIGDYSNVVGDRYTAVDDLPADNWYASQHVLMMRDGPAAWPALSQVQMMVHSWDDELKLWHKEPIAFTQNSVTPKRAVVGSLVLVRTPRFEKQLDWEASPPMLPAGKYLIKVYFDSKHRLATDPTAMLGDQDYQGQVEMEADWKNGFPNAHKFSADALK
ncbi:MAG: hypothetical protein WBD20_20940 [Pirellulaceae bacterium]